MGMDSFSRYCEYGGLFAGLYLPSPSRVDDTSQDQDQMSSIKKPSVKPVKTLKPSQFSMEVIEDEQSYEVISDTFINSECNCVHTCTARRSIENDLPSTDSHRNCVHVCNARRSIDSYLPSANSHLTDTYHSSSAKP